MRMWMWKGWHTTEFFIGLEKEIRLLRAYGIKIVSYAEHYCGTAELPVEFFIPRVGSWELCGRVKRFHRAVDRLLAKMQEAGYPRRVRKAFSRVVTGVSRESFAS